DFHVTGVQTCALPICDVDFHIRKEFAGDTLRSRIQFYSYSANPNMWGQSISIWGEAGHPVEAGLMVTSTGNVTLAETPFYSTAKLGRASCRDRGEIAV